MAGVSVVIGTFGSEDWRNEGQKALFSVYDQTVLPVSIHHRHATTLAEARNAGAAAADGDWLCFLDADDRLDPGYIEAMTKAIDELDGEKALLQPSHRNDKDRPTGKAGEITIIPPCNIRRGNYLIIGTLVPRDIFTKVGGFSDEFDLYEDWELWIRCMLHEGLSSRPVPDAIYEIKVREDSRNEPSKAKKLQIAAKIRRKHGL